MGSTKKAKNPRRELSGGWSNVARGGLKMRNTIISWVISERISMDAVMSLRRDKNSG